MPGQHSNPGPLANCADTPTAEPCIHDLPTHAMENSKGNKKVSISHFQIPVSMTSPAETWN